MRERAPEDALFPFGEETKGPFSPSCFFHSGTLTVEEVYKDRDQFASLVREVAAPDVGRMGIEILSFTIKDVYDNVTYLASLGKAQTAAVKRDAEIGVAQVKEMMNYAANSLSILAHKSPWEITRIGLLLECQPAS